MKNGVVNTFQRERAWNPDKTGAVCVSRDLFLARRLSMYFNIFSRKYRASPPNLKIIAPATRQQEINEGE